MVLEGMKKGKVLEDSQQNDKKVNYRQNYLHVFFTPFLDVVRLGFFHPQMLKF